MSAVALGVTLRTATLIGEFFHRQTEGIFGASLSMSNTWSSDSGTRRRNRYGQSKSAGLRSGLQRYPSPRYRSGRRSLLPPPQRQGQRARQRKSASKTPGPSKRMQRHASRTGSPPSPTSSRPPPRVPRRTTICRPPSGRPKSLAATLIRRSDSRPAQYSRSRASTS